MGAKSNDFCLHKRREAQTPREEGHVETEAQEELMHPQGEERQEPPEAGRGRKLSPLQTSGEAWPC